MLPILVNALSNGSKEIRYKNTIRRWEKGAISTSNVKSINSLMKYLRDEHGIDISGSVHKRKLRNIGYYHGYKGYRFIKEPKRRINYTHFNEILSVNTFDMELKALLYPSVMFIETALKNYVLEVVLEEANTGCFNIIYENLLIGYKDYQGNKNYKPELRRRLSLRNKIFNALSRDYNNNRQIVQHFYHQDRAVPIWAIFEVISLGEFGNFVSCLGIDTKHKISKALGLNRACDAKGKLTEYIIFIINDLRNAVAHNDVIFDTRFRRKKANNALIKCLCHDTKINNISFNTIVDYLILIVYILKNLCITKTELNKVVTEFERIADDFRNRIPISTYSKILYTDTRNKLNQLKIYLKN